MSFQHSAEDGRVDDGHMLRARLCNTSGEWIDAEIDLNQFIGNDDGHFVWDGFAHSADNVEFSIEADGEAAVLRAHLTNSEGEQVEADINLAERIGNSDGSFVYA